MSHERQHINLRSAAYPEAHRGTVESEPREERRLLPCGRDRLRVPPKGHFRNFVRRKKNGGRRGARLARGLRTLPDRCIDPAERSMIVLALLAMLINGNKTGKVSATRSVANGINLE